MRFVLYGLLAGILCLAAPPRGAPRSGPAFGWPSDTVLVEDDAGRVVQLAEPARRIVSLVPALTEALYAIGAGERLVGRTRYDRHPPEARSVPSVGGGIQPSAEAIRALDPDLVILHAGPDNRGVAEELERVGLRALAVRHNTLADLERNLGRLGRLTGCEVTAARLEATLAATLAAVGETTGTLPTLRVYYDVWWEPPITVGAGSYLDSLLTLAGARNVFGELQVASPQVSLEAIAARDPDLLLWPSEPGSAAPPGGAAPSQRPGWQVLRAVREGRVRRVDGELLHRLGPRVGEAALQLAQAIHPEAANRLESVRVRAGRSLSDSCEGVR